MTRPAPSPRYGLFTWLAAGGLAVCAAVTMALAGPWAAADVPVNAAASIIAGMIVLCAFAPWSGVLAWRRRHRALEALAVRLGSVGEGGEPAELRELLRSEEGRALGRLIPAVDSVAREIAMHRRAERRLHRNLGDGIRRETHRRTLHLQKQALTDPLTGLGNRRRLELCLRDWAEEPPGRATDFVVAMIIDLDNFKIVNDTLGHEAGDDCLIFMGQLLRSSVRREDVAVRMGGDEFVVLMPGQTVPTARRSAERLAALFGQIPWTHRDVPRPSLSIGLAAVEAHQVGDGRGLIRAADEALYRAKRGGRNRIEGLADPRPPRRSAQVA